MAKSKSGGTRSYIRGRVGADVYSIGKNAKGAKQQVVRSLAETVANPQTIDQMRGRMIMSTVMQAVSGLKSIIDHSFDNVPAGQPSISEFISRNYALVKDDAVAHPASGNMFGLNAYHVKGIQPGAWIVSNGDAVLPSAAEAKATGFQITLPADAVTVAGLKSALGYNDGDYLTYVAIAVTDGEGDENVYTPYYVRLKIKDSLSDETVISSSNVNALFDIEGNFTPTFTLDTNVIKYTADGWNQSCRGMIISKKESGSYKHSTCVLTTVANIGDSADEVLPSYPVGSELFLNGGDL